jgi:hypothetical protein
MQTYLPNFQIQELCCNLLNAFAGFGSLASEVVDAVATAMRTHPTQFSLQTAGCDILGVIAKTENWELCIASVPLVQSV